MNPSFFPFFQRIFACFYPSPFLILTMLILVHNAEINWTRCKIAMSKDENFENLKSS